jgi:hypothetical protein
MIGSLYKLCYCLRSLVFACRMVYCICFFISWRWFLLNNKNACNFLESIYRGALLSLTKMFIRWLGNTLQSRNIEGWSEIQHDWPIMCPDLLKYPKMSSWEENKWNDLIRILYWFWAFRVHWKIRWGQPQIEKLFGSSIFWPWAFSSFSCID